MSELERLQKLYEKLWQECQLADLNGWTRIWREKRDHANSIAERIKHLRAQKEAH